MKKVKWLDAKYPKQFMNKYIKEVYKNDIHFIIYKIIGIYGKCIRVIGYGSEEELCFNEESIIDFVLPDKSYCEQNEIKIEILNKSDMLLELL